jgi:glutamine synthetase
MSIIDSALEKIKQYEFVDLRFTDTKGKEQHVTVPAHQINKTFCSEGKNFDGSSIAGWKHIHESDMILMPDLSTLVEDPFTNAPTIILRCDVVDPATMQGYGRDPRSVAARAEQYLKSTGIADSALFGPEPEFFVFDKVLFQVSMNECGFKIDSIEGAWNSNHDYEDGNSTR